MIPHKQNIIPYVDELTEAAEAIGAVNTVVVKKDDDDHGSVQEKKRVLVGDNTDWRGIFNPLQRRLGGSVASTTGSNDGTKNVALILGGGGTARATAYAATQLGPRTCLLQSYTVQGRRTGRSLWRQRRILSR